MVNILDEICDHMDGFSSAEEACIERCGASTMSYTKPTKVRDTSQPTFTVGSSGPADTRLYDPPSAGSPLIVIALLLRR